jgi:hypothetical protein
MPTDPIEEAWISRGNYQTRRRASRYIMMGGYYDTGSLKEY